MMDHALLSLLAAGPVSDPWYDNGWLIGIVTGLASGVLLAVATSIFLRMRAARKRAPEGERPEFSEKPRAPAASPSPSPLSVIFGTPLHLGSGDINQAARDIHTQRGSMPSVPPHGSGDSSTDPKATDENK